MRDVILLAVSITLVLIRHEYRCGNFGGRWNDHGNGVLGLLLLDTLEVIMEVTTGSRLHRASEGRLSRSSDVRIIVRVAPRVFDRESIVLSFEKNGHAFMWKPVNVNVSVAEEDQSLMVGTDSLAKIEQFLVKYLNEDTVIVESTSVLLDLALVSSDTGDEAVELLTESDTVFLVSHSVDLEIFNIPDGLS